MFGYDPPSFSFFLFFFSDIVMLGRLGDQCVIDLILVVVLITPRSSRLCTYYHHLVSPFRAGPGDVAVVRFRRCVTPQGILMHCGGPIRPVCLLLSWILII